jgi:type II secretory pathway pseudopilin PulG
LCDRLAWASQPAVHAFRVEISRAKDLARFSGGKGLSKMGFLKTNHEKSARRERGTTLVELSVVIAVLLLLVTVLLIGAAAWKSGANAAACIINLSSIQKAVRGYENMNGLTVGGTVTVSSLTSSGFWSTVPVCPAGGTYTPLGTVPAPGTAYMTCSITGHRPSATTLTNW